MAIWKHVRHEPDGRAALGNALGGCHIGLHASRDVLAFVRAGREDLLADSSPDFSDRTTDDLRFFLNLRRFTSRGPNLSEQVNGDLLPLHSENVPDLTGNFVYTVTWLGRLPAIMRSDDRDRLRERGIDLPINGVPDNPGVFREQIEELQDVDRQFYLADGKCIGRQIMWFTTQGLCEGVLRDSGANGRGLADSFCDALGLGRHPAGRWLVLLEIPGNAVQQAGHYRPAFCDSILLPSWFMARSSWCDDRSAEGGWGQTANLDALARGDSSCDGGPERVARQLFRHHFGDSPLRFQLLGPVEFPNGTEQASEALARMIWMRRR